MARPTKRTFRPTSSNPSSTPTHLPSLPCTIQTSLLNVGMRIRKAVPEGYKTVSKPHYSSTNSNNNLPPPPAPTNDASSSRISSPPHTSNNNNRINTLLPYCGILKTGNLETYQHHQQEETNSHSYSYSLPPLDFSAPAGGEDSEFWPSSQESDPSTIPPQRFDTLPLLVNTNKRLFEEGGEDDDSDVRPPLLASVIHPDPLRSNPFLSAVAAGRREQEVGLRPMLQPRTRKEVGRKKEQVEIVMGDGDGDGAEGFGMEFECDFDFGEAPFLRFEGMAWD
ncbi:MAG: hypothetical protein Q9191_006779 [Dirinaria sp. TL-2023a]